MKVYNKEKQLGLEEKILAKAACIAHLETKPADIPTDSLPSDRATFAKRFFKDEWEQEYYESMADDGTLFFNAVLVSTVWNKNDDVFTQEDTWAARGTPRHKPVNINHNGNEFSGNQNIGVMVYSFTVNDNMEQVYNYSDTSAPEDFRHIVVSSVLWARYFPTAIESITEDLKANKLFVSMEALFDDFGYALREKGSTEGETRLIQRNEYTSFLSQYLRVYGGAGEFEGKDGKTYQVGRWLQKITFSGMGIVEKPANPDSIIFDDYVLKASERPNIVKVSESEVHKIFNAQENCVLDNTAKGNFLLWLT